MKSTLLFALGLWASASMAADFKPFDGPKPIAVLIQTDPWAMVIGADTPRVVIYEGGEAIFAKKVNGTVGYHRIVLDEAALETFREQAQPVITRKTLRSSYDVTAGVTDQPESLFYLRDGARELITRVYGLRAAGTKLPARPAKPERHESARPPDELLQLHRWLCAFDSAKSEPWTPRYIEVMFWGYSYAPDTSIQWPKDWPSLTSDRAIKRRDAYSIFLDGALLPKLQEFLATRKEKGAVELDGKKWAVSYRFTFPSEPTWRAAFSKSEEQ